MTEKKKTRGKTGNPYSHGAPNAFNTYAAIISKYSAKPIDELRSIDTTAIAVKEAFVIQQMIEIYDSKSLSRLSWISDRDEGTPAETVSHVNLTKEEYERIRKGMIKKDDC